MKRLFLYLGFLSQTLFISNYVSAQFFLELSHNQAPELTVIQLDSLYIDKGESVQLGDIEMVSGGTQPYTYLWDPPSGLDNSNMPNPLASPQETTSYTLLVVDNIACQLITQQTVIVDSSFNTTEESLSANFLVYPNPSNGVFSYILSDQDKSSELIITIYSVAGQEVLRKEDIIPVNTSSGQINLDHSPKGIYILLIQTNKGIYREIISIQ